MPEINKADVYRKAAEVIVRDGKHDGGLVAGGYRQTRRLTYPERIADRSLPVCALGACARAQFELYGVLDSGGAEAYDEYSFTVKGFEFPAGVDKYHLTPYIENVNDFGNVSAEDIALLLKRRAEEVDGG